MDAAKKKLIDTTFFINAEMYICQPGLGGSTNPSIEMRPKHIDEATEDAFVKRVERMVRHAFEAARNQASDCS